MSIRFASHNDVDAIKALVTSLSRFYLKEQGATLPAWFLASLSTAAFLKRIHDSAYLNWVFEREGHVLAYLALKDGRHLYHLFVAETHQGQGIARMLWEHALTQCTSPSITVRSSLFAVPAYKKLGFIEIAPKGEKDGIEFQALEFFRK